MFRVDIITNEIEAKGKQDTSNGTSFEWKIFGFYPKINMTLNSFFLE